MTRRQFALLIAGGVLLVVLAFQLGSTWTGLEGQAERIEALGDSLRTP